NFRHFWIFYRNSMASKRYALAESASELPVPLPVASHILTIEKSKCMSGLN
ncbi:MAG: hypothetical protein ACI936_003558, partial [Paraglaciecola sp.]